jgi:hypothetical protein
MMVVSASAQTFPTRYVERKADDIILLKVDEVDQEEAINNQAIDGEEQRDESMCRVVEECDALETLCPKRQKRGEGFLWLGTGHCERTH